MPSELDDLHSGRVTADLKLEIDYMNLKMPVNGMRSCEKVDSDSVGLGWGQRPRIANKAPVMQSLCAVEMVWGPQ